MSCSGDLHENRLTGERSLILHGTDDGPERRIVAHVTVPAKVAVIGEHLHPSIHEHLLVVSGRMGLRIEGRERSLGPGEEADLPPGVVHDWWNAGEAQAEFIVEVDPADRFELMVSTLFGLASDGKTNAKGMPNLLQIAVLAWEFNDIVRFVRPPRVIQRTLFGALAPIGRALGYLPVYGKYVRPTRGSRPTPRSWRGPGSHRRRSPAPESHSGRDGRLLDEKQKRRQARADDRFRREAEQVGDRGCRKRGAVCWRGKRFVDSWILRGVGAIIVVGGC